MDPILTRGTLLCRIGVVHQVPVNIMLQYESRRIEPVIEDLASHNMSSHAPTVLPPLMPQPVMTKNLRVKVMCLKARMMDMALRAFEEEKAVVVHELLAAVKSAEAIEVASGGIVDQFGREEVEVGGVELEGFGEVGHAYPEMP
jgi:hypothetical protein